METLLSKKAQLQTTVDITNVKSQEDLKEAERKLDILISKAGQNAQDVITKVYPQSNASVRVWYSHYQVVAKAYFFKYFLFQHGLVDVFPLAARLLGSPVIDTYSSSYDMQRECPNFFEKNCSINNPQCMYVDHLKGLAKWNHLMDLLNQLEETCSQFFSLSRELARSQTQGENTTNWIVTKEEEIGLFADQFILLVQLLSGGSNSVDSDTSLDTPEWQDLRQEFTQKGILKKEKWDWILRNFDLSLSHQQECLSMEFLEWYNFSF